MGAARCFFDDPFIQAFLLLATGAQLLQFDWRLMSRPTEALAGANPLDCGAAQVALVPQADVSSMTSGASAASAERTALMSITWTVLK